MQIERLIMVNTHKILFSDAHKENVPKTFNLLMLFIIKAELFA